MSDTPDLSKIVNLIMQNPSLISEISALANGDNGDSEKKTADTPPKEEEKEKAPSKRETVSRNERRARLLGAMRPYLNEERARSLDTVITVAEMIEAVRSK